MSLPQPLIQTHLPPIPFILLSASCRLVRRPGLLTMIWFAPESTGYTIPYVSVIKHDDVYRRWFVEEGEVCVDSIGETEPLVTALPYCLVC